MHPISQHGHFKNSLNRYERQRNYRITRWHMLHHVHLLEELTTSSLTHKIDYTQSCTQLWSKTKTWDTYQKVGAHVEHVVKVLLCGCSVPIGADMVIRTINPLCVWDGDCSVVRALRYGYCLRGDRGRERETEWTTTFLWCPAKKFGSKKWCQNNLGSNGREEMSPGPLLLTIKVTYAI
jgi:hypothetical protein